MPKLAFSHPEPPRSRRRLWPVFLPQAGCPHRCLFCDQSAQTGAEPAAPGDVLETLARRLENAAARGEEPFEVGFYGGTFTALPDGWPGRFLDLLRPYRAAGLVLGARCSTRPDAVDLDGLLDLKARGLDLVELGIQSFDDGALAASGRGYSGAMALEGCGIVRAAGLGLGVQLLPGLPGDRPGLFRRDVAVTARLRPDCARLYPCLVLEGTGLARLWRRGEYAAWSGGRARAELSVALTRLWRAGVPVIRLGVAPEAGLSVRILAGPAHPALGQQARSLALWDHVRRMAARLGRAPRGLLLPPRAAGEFWGQRRSLARAYARLGLRADNVRPGGPDFVLE